MASNLIALFKNFEDLQSRMDNCIDKLECVKLCLDENETFPAKNAWTHGKYSPYPYT